MVPTAHRLLGASVSKRILIIEDEPNIIESLSFLLQRSGFETFSESDGALAMQALARHSPHLVILDVMLPNRSGFDILRDIITIVNRPKVLMLTAKGQSKDRLQAGEIGVDRFITKPFSNSEIIETINVLLA